MLAEHIEYLTFAEFAREANLSESEIRLLVIRERIVPSLWLESFSLKPTARAGLYYLLSPRQTGAHNCCFLNASKVRFARGEVSVSDREPNTNFYDVMPITLDMVVAHGVLTRDELRRIAPAAMTSEPAAPLMAGEHLTAAPTPPAQARRASPSTADEAPATPDLPWWQQEHRILEMAQNIGARLYEKNDPKQKPSASNVAKEIATRIAALERASGKDRRTPNWDTVRGVLIGWRFKPD